ncbi:MAG: hypothetical protein GY875_02220 [Gammaproteobacteria bacterium]|nr:hypothetical protein [Gammaproteobacteria bacterium]
MNNPYKPPDSSLSKTLKRTFTTALITPLSVLMVILIFAGYIYFFFTNEEVDIFGYFTSISFEVFLASQAGMILLTIFTKKQLDAFLVQHPVISDQKPLENLKPVARAIMFLALIHLLLPGIGSLAAIMSILNYGGMISIGVVGVSIITGIVTKASSKSEERIKQIECTETTLEKELTDILYCWQHKPFPNF